MRKYLVSEMSKKQKEKIKLKALKLGVTIDDLIIHSIDVYSPDIKCKGCDNLNPTTTYKHAVVAGASTLNCTVEDVPTLYCNDCNEDIYDLEFIAKLNEIVEQMMLDKFIQTRETSFVFHYSEIEAME